MNEVTEVETALGKRLMAYYYEDEQLLLKFEDETILQWSGYYCRPTDVDELGIREIVTERINDEWRTLNNTV